MLKRKKPRTKGKISFSKYFQEFKEGDSVAVSRELSLPLGYSKRVQGRTGKVIKKQGEAYYVEIKDLNKPKRYFIRPIHLNKIKNSKNKSQEFLSVKNPDNQILEHHQDLKILRPQTGGKHISSLSN